MFCQLAGRKHHYPERQVQEDLFGTLSFESRGQVVWGCYVCDGHGVSYISSSTELSGAERFQALLKPVLNRVVNELIEEALVDADTGAGSTATCIEGKLELLNQRLDEEMMKLDEHLCKENGSTLSLAILYSSTLFCCNIGDSQILMFDRNDPTGKPLKVWKLRRHVDMLLSSPPGLSVTAADAALPTAESCSASVSPSGDHSASPTPKRFTKPEVSSTETQDADTHTCSFPDSLFVQEGTVQKYISKEYSLLRERALKAGGGGPMGGYIHSAKSRYRLGMTCSIGNISHKDNLLVRTSVYAFDVESLLEKTIDGRILIVITSDGIKDLVKSHFIGQTFINLSKTIRSMSAASVGTIVNTNRRPISTCMSDLIPRPTEDAHDRAAKEHLEKLISVFERSQSEAALQDQPSSSSLQTTPPHPLTDTKIAVEALCDLAILKGSTDDITVAAFEITCFPSPRRSANQTEYRTAPLQVTDYQDGNDPKDFVFIPAEKKWHVVEPLYCSGTTQIPPRNTPKPPPIIQKLLASVAAGLNKSVSSSIGSGLKPIVLETPLPPTSIGWGAAVLPPKDGSGGSVASGPEFSSGSSAIQSFHRLSESEKVDMMDEDSADFSSGSVSLSLPLGASNMELSTPLQVEKSRGGSGTASEEGTPTRKRKGSESLARQDLVK
ncbi:hypothetical protein BDR26DRAFT_930109 [Obelidium mucronatum]|nr:hypothetical protein BDR26DRAFT_930109 [Obelidium mucronatum]